MAQGIPKGDSQGPPGTPGLFRDEYLAKEYNNWIQIKYYEKTTKSKIDFFVLSQLTTPLIRKKDLLAHLILIENNEFKKNDFYLDNGLVNTNIFYSNRSKKMLTYSWCGIYSPKLFSNIERGKKFPLVKLLNNASDRNLISGERFTGEWFDVGTRDRLKKLKKLKKIKNYEH